MADWTRVSLFCSSEFWCCGGDSRPREQADGRQPGFQGYQAQIAGLRYRQGHRRPEPIPRWHGFRFHECDWPAHRECEALFHNGKVWARQPEASVWYGRGLNCGLFHPLLPLVEDKDVNQWKPRAARLSYPGILVS
ncbi:hypothetical protein LEMLEM_LOCUS2901 [Lemmus lemmus]